MNWLIAHHSGRGFEELATYEIVGIVVCLLLLSAHALGFHETVFAWLKRKHKKQTAGE